MIDKTNLLGIEIYITGKEIIDFSFFKNFPSKLTFKEIVLIEVLATTTSLVVVIKSVANC